MLTPTVITTLTKRLTIPIRLSRHNITELLVAAEQTASFFPCNNEINRESLSPALKRAHTYATEQILTMVEEKTKHAK